MKILLLLALLAASSAEAFRPRGAGPIPVSPSVPFQLDVSHLDGGDRLQ